MLLERREVRDQRVVLEVTTRGFKTRRTRRDSLPVCLLPLYGSFPCARGLTSSHTGTVYEADDQEADNIYEAVDARMEERRRKRKEAREQAEHEEYLRNNPKIQEQFSDLKRGLGTVSDIEWEKCVSSCFLQRAIIADADAQPT